jgi:enediyne biosynthesis protein E4
MHIVRERRSARPPCVSWSRLIAVLIPCLLFLVPSAHATVETVHVMLSAGGPTSLAQGLPFAVKARANNPDPGQVTVGVTIEVSYGGGTPIHALLWTVTIPGLGSAKTSVSVTPAQWFTELGTYEIAPTISGQPAGAPLQVEVLSPTVGVALFQDVTPTSGISTTLPGPTCGRYGAGAAWGDANGDGLLDLYVPAMDGPAQLWIQDTPGHFTDQAAERGVDNPARVGMGAVFADYDNDGDLDLYVTNDGPNRLYQNDGSGHFTDVAVQAGVADAGAGPSSAWGDYDNDGYLDLYVVNFTDCGSSGQPDKLYHNEGNGSFTDQTALLGPLEETTGNGWQAAWFDYNGDGRQDLYLANDKIPNAPPGNHLWRNDGPGSKKASWLFTDVSADSGMGFTMAAMGIGIADFDRDLDLDVAISNILGNVVARNNGDGTFTNVAADVHAARPWQSADVHSVTWGLAFYDFNLDGWEDLYAAAGSIPDTTPQPNELFIGDGHGKFLDLSAPSGAADDATSRGVAFADYDGDGLVDFYVLDQWGNSRLYRNVTPVTGLHWLEVRTAGTVSNRDGCGARLFVTAGGVRMLREVLCGSTSLASGSDSTAHFGLGTATSIAKLVILWPSGVRQVLRNIAPDQRIVVTEP